MRYRGQGGFAHILIILAVIVLAVFWLVVYKVSNGQSNKVAKSEGQTVTSDTTQKTTCSISGGSIEAPRVSAAGAFTSAITDINTITSISSGKQVGDPRVTYLWIKDKQRIPVFAPADGTLIKIEYKKPADLPASL